MILTETWLNRGIPDTAIELTGGSTHRAHRTADNSGKTRGGGLCIYINKTWRTDSVTLRRHCSANVEFLMVKCRPYYLPREFISVIITAAYIPQDANATLAMNKLQRLLVNNSPPTRRLHLLLRVTSTIQTQLCSQNSTNMFPAIQEETKLGTMSTQTWLVPIRQHLSPT